ncbi:hypothetical protein QE152_g30398 [Popillia japonica]|uniref:FXYD domain-containing ion transport regulator n=1 Tax=Popillia japonica TaxID=7064 RepID=A0AAW1JFA1_POPJA
MTDMKPSVSLEASGSDTIPSIFPSTNCTSEEQVKINFYRTYDVMTGVRIAATLGGFFVLMVILVVYKSKSKTERALKDPTLAAAAHAEAEEEERQISALEASVYQTLNTRKL